MRINCGVFIEEMISFTTYKFENKIYLGCPQNSIYHFDKYGYDEIVIINKTKYIDSFQLLFLKILSEASYKPKCYGGGVKSFLQAKHIVEIGFERISVRDLFFESRTEYLKIIQEIGRQGVTLCIDVQLFQGVYFIVSNNKIVMPLVEFTLDDENMPGELFVNNIDLNGTLSGPDILLLKQIMEKKLKTNINYCGGIRDIEDVNIVKQFGISAVTIFTAASTINNGNQKLINNSFFK